MRKEVHPGARRTPAALQQPIRACWENQASAVVAGVLAASCSTC